MFVLQKIITIFFYKPGIYDSDVNLRISGQCAAIEVVRTALYFNGCVLGLQRLFKDVKLDAGHRILNFII